MLAFVARRLVYTVVVMWAASVVVFLALRITPGDPTNFVTNPVQTNERKAAVRHQLGIDQPILHQYWRFTRRLVTWNFGPSFITKQPITEIVAKAVPRTLELAAAALVLVLALGIPLGVLAALRRGSLFDHLIGTAAALGMGIPNFVLAIILIKLLALKLQWLPVSGTGGFRFLILPAIVLALEPLALTIRMMRSSVLEQLGQDYVRTLEAKGLSRRRVVWLHVLKNALGPIISLTAVQLRSLLGYTLIVEVIFRWPGLGQQLVNAVLTRDFPVAQFLALLLTLAVIVLSFLGDVGLAAVDPRVRRSARR
jgi:ABC-type dipeptide/oligopeptide/nickel transport system permease component